MEWDFYKFIINNENKEVSLIIFNIITKEKWIVNIYLNWNWPGADFLLGFRVWYESIDLAC